MKTKLEHIAVIPARQNSKSLPNKNRFLFKYTAKFLKEFNIFNKVYVNSDDPYLEVLAKKNNFHFFKRQKKLAKDNTCIKEVFVDMNNRLKFSKNTFIWLFYIPLVYRKISDFKKVYKIVEFKIKFNLYIYKCRNTSYELLVYKKINHFNLLKMTYVGDKIFLKPTHIITIYVALMLIFWKNLIMS